MRTHLKTTFTILISIALLAVAACGGTAAGLKYKVIYDGNGHTSGTPPVDDSSYAEGTIVTARGNNGNLVKTGYEFAGWNTQADGEGANFEGGDTLTMGASDLTLYAKWSRAYDIGDTGPAGGLVFYDKGAFSDGWRYLEAAPGDQSDGMSWYNGANVETGATSMAIGNGQANTASIVAAQGAGSYAAQVCNDLELGGFDDWFLPSADELDLMFKNLARSGLGGFDGTRYWSSTETIIDFADCQFFDTGSANDAEKSNTFRVRAVRAY